ncbi:MAG: helix-turn-helix transcriptional regulator [Bacteroidetes bacterium]|nr:helix-turn-helix transcriptional regulator [Bacteroidota bacterium]
MASYCPYCHSVKSILVGNVYCSRHGVGMEKLNNGTMMIKTPKLEETDWHITRLSIRCMLNGEQYYKVGSRECTVTKDNFLVMNQGQTYKTSFEGKTDLEMFLVAFKPGFAEGIFQSLVSSEEWLLDNPHYTPKEPLRFFEKTFDADEKMMEIFAKLRKIMLEENAEIKRALDLDHLYTQVIERLIQIHFGIYSDIRTKGYVKSSTGVELYKRLGMAKDFMDSNYTSDISLEDIAKNSFLSVSHFKRLFKEYYETTPHQYIIQKRLEKAKDLLMQSDMPVRNICGAIGFENTSSFIRLFKNSYDLTPLSFRGQSGES